MLNSLPAARRPEHINVADEGSTLKLQIPMCKLSLISWAPKHMGKYQLSIRDGQTEWVDSLESGQKERSWGLTARVQTETLRCSWSKRVCCRWRTWEQSLWRAKNWWWTLVMTLLQHQRLLCNYQGTADLIWSKLICFALESRWLGCCRCLKGRGSRKSRTYNIRMQCKLEQRVCCQLRMVSTHEKRRSAWGALLDLSSGQTVSRHIIHIMSKEFKDQALFEMRKELAVLQWSKKGRWRLHAIKMETLQALDCGNVG